LLDCGCIAHRRCYPYVATACIGRKKRQHRKKVSVDVDKENDKPNHKLKTPKGSTEDLPKLESSLKKSKEDLRKELSPSKTDENSKKLESSLKKSKEDLRKELSPSKKEVSPSKKEEDSKKSESRTSKTSNLLQQAAGFLDLTKLK
jgi:hypothetical protein